jgi:hypothetical protein
MPTTINASNTSGGAIITPDGSGVLELQSGGVTGLTVSGANVTVSGTLTATGGLAALTSPVSVIGNASAGAEIRLPEDTDNGANYVAIKAPNALAANLTFTLPTADGTNGQYLQTNGSGQLAFATVPTTTPGGTTGQIQFNNAGVFGGVTAVPAANGGTGLTAPGTAGNLLTSNGTTWTSAPATSGVRQFTASGSITAGQPVCLRSDGAVEVATGFQQTETLGAAQIRAGADSNTATLIVPIPGTSNLLITINNGATKQVLVASVSGTTITYNTPTTVPAGMTDGANIACTFDPVSGSALFTYSASSQWRGVVCTITGTTVAFGSPQVIATQGAFNGQASCYDPLRQQIIIGATYYDNSYSNQRFQIQRATISGLSFTTVDGGIVTSGSGVANALLNLLYDTTVDRIVSTLGTSGVNNVILITNSGSGLISVAASTALGISPGMIAVTFDSVNNKYVAVAPDGSNNPVARTFSITASSIAIDAAPTFPLLPESRVISNGDARVSYDVRSERVVYIFYTNANNIRYITSTGFGASMVFSSYNATALLTRAPRLTYLPAQNRTIFYIINDSDGANLRSFLPAADISNTQNFIGLAAASATTGQTLNVTVTGGTNANQTGLTTGASYFLTSLGALTTAGGVRVGEALSTTSMFVEGRLNSSGTPSASTFLRGDGAFAALPASTVTLISSATLTTNAAQILINNIPVTSYSSIIIELMVKVDSSTQIYFGFVAPGGTANNSLFYGRYTEGRSDNPAGNSFGVNGLSTWRLNPISASASSEIGAIINVQQTNQTTTKRGLTVQGFGDASSSVGYSYYGGGYSNTGSWGGIRITNDGVNFVAGSYYRIYGVL